MEKHIASPRRASLSLRGLARIEDLRRRCPERTPIGRMGTSNALGSPSVSSHPGSRATVESTRRPTHRSANRSRPWRRCRKRPARTSTWPSSTRGTRDNGDAIEPKIIPGLVDQGYTGQRATDAAAQYSIELAMGNLPMAKKGFMPMPWRWVCRLARDYGRLPETVRGLHFLAFACLTLNRFAALFTQSA